MNFRALFLTSAMLAGLGLHAQPNNGPIDPPDGVRALLQVKGDGVQIYTCTNVQNGPHWVLKEPNAKLLDQNGEVIGVHIAGPTWKLNDGGVVQGQAIASQPSPDPKSVPWLLLRAKPGTASGSLGSVTFIRRTDTHGGVADSTGCQDASGLGKTTEVAYTATYTFYVPK